MVAAESPAGGRSSCQQRSDRLGRSRYAQFVMPVQAVRASIVSAAYTSRILWAQVSCVRFSPEHEILWAGTESGNVYSLQFPSLERYASVRCGSPFWHPALTLP